MDPGTIEHRLLAAAGSSAPIARERLRLGLLLVDIGSHLAYDECHRADLATAWELLVPYQARLDDILRRVQLGPEILR